MKYADRFLSKKTTNKIYVYYIGLILFGGFSLFYVYSLLTSPEYAARNFSIVNLLIFSFYLYICFDCFTVIKNGKKWIKEVEVNGERVFVKNIYNKKFDLSDREIAAVYDAHYNYIEEKRYFRNDEQGFDVFFANGDSIRIGPNIEEKDHLKEIFTSKKRFETNM